MKVLGRRAQKRDTTDIDEFAQLFFGKTPLAVLFDERDTMAQERIPLENLKTYLTDKLSK